MDGREGITMTSSPSSFYYMPREIGTSGTGTDFSSHLPSVPVPIRFIPNPVSHFPIQSSHQSTFHTGSPTPEPVQQPVTPVPINAGTSLGAAGTELVKKKKRGRPMKYVPEGSVGLALSPISVSAPQCNSSGLKRRGRPPGTGTKQQLASLGKWIAGSAGMGFTPHVIRLSVGEDISSKIMSFSQEGPRAVCVLSANGAVSCVTLRQPSSSGTVTYQGCFEILTLSGSCKRTETDGGSRSRTGGLSISLSSRDGRVFGGSVAGSLLAASPILLIVGSFIYAGLKEKIRVRKSLNQLPNQFSCVTSSIQLD